MDHLANAWYIKLVFMIMLIGICNIMILHLIFYSSATHLSDEPK
jgi:hypothetical protein